MRPSILSDYAYFFEISFHRDLPSQHQLEARHRVVHVEGGVLLVLGDQGVNLDVIVEDGPDRLLLGRHKLVLEDELVHRVVKAPNLEGADLSEMEN